MKRKWLKYDIIAVVKMILGPCLFLSTAIGLPWFLMKNKVEFAYVFVFLVVWAVVFTFVILPMLRYKTLWRGNGKLKDYRLIRTVGKFSLIKDGLFGNFQIIEDKNKDGIPDNKVEKHFMGRSGFWTYPRKLEDIDYHAFREAMKSIKNE